MFDGTEVLLLLFPEITKNKLNNLHKATEKPGKYHNYIGLKSQHVWCPPKTRCVSFDVDRYVQDKVRSFSGNLVFTGDVAEAPS